MLGSKLVPFAQSIANNQTLMQINLTNNMLSRDEEVAICMKLMNSTQNRASLPYHHLLEQFDQVYE